MQVALFMFTPDGQRRRFPLQRDVTVIGRREDCDLRIPLTEVSRKHCRLVKDANGLRLEDLGSSNGTFHNGSRVQESLVQPGDHVQIGPVLFTVQIDGFPSDEMIEAPGTKTADDSALGAEDSVVDTIPSPSTPPTPRAPTKRPAAPEGDDFVVADDEKKDNDDSIVDLEGVSPSPEVDQR
jgi:pSer/pThr/pTyr-binding forkhead associated (FHA) protein